ncbi:membrane protein [Streptomyces phage Zuko]|uniref:Membrane protein n=1 Tax=Streptomyces phage Zuko TaxID=2601695 RepID=A0A5J6D717_9CAUD|nr:membrane protein [Streptomyces phage Zuko]QEQ93630.1 membrane protein [Streptomyces phage Zuko]
MGNGNFREGAKWYAKGWGIFLLALVSVLAASTITLFATGTIQKWTADFRGGVKAKEQTTGNGAFRVNTYNHFFNLCASVQSDEDAIKNAQDEMADKETTADRKAKLRQVVTALKNTRAENIRQYNADSANEYKRAFQSNDLPVTLNVGAERTECAYAQASTD